MLPNHFRVPAPKPELEYFCFLLEHFWATGPNGAHICIVLPLLGPSIAHATDYFFDQPFVLKSVCRQMALAMQLLHSRNICHGEFCPSHIFFKASDEIHRVSEEEMVALLGHPHLVKTKSSPPDDSETFFYTPWGEVEFDDHGFGCRVNVPDEEQKPPSHYEGTFDTTLGPHLPQYLVKPVNLAFPDAVAKLLISESDPSIAIIGWGSCYEPFMLQRSSTRIPTPYAAPENLLGIGSLSYGSDVWSLAATIFHAASGKPPFQSHLGPQEVILCLEDYLGPMPLEYRSAWMERSAEAIYLRTGARMQGPLGPGLPPDLADPSLPVSRMKRLIKTTQDRRMEQWGTRDFLEVDHVLGHLERQRDVGFDYFSWRLTIAPSVPTDEPIASEEWGEPVMLTGLLKLMFKWLPEDRPDMDRVMRHPWISNPAGFALVLEEGGASAARHT
jgi:serine/threonine protein kinase